ncbi:preprotein translocase subunit SecA [Lacticaseibacillus saniviri JCM 17471 = DSM 24301]|uniref:Protein translocase subunit SecA n=1 Tax=Lacticaseibacillus saniviri JCM 17471 = DSM 24301 TaxID=1293598 RepID=A0A0R2MUM1_9LACO|nr:preprotein translocase subunit SecA [Lacticaseibacillus saniviri JCM 17471 = DSM 24301]
MDRVIATAKDYRELSDKDLQHKTIEFREALASGQTLEQLIVPAYATVVEADRRILGLTPFPVQILGAIVMQYGNIAEMKTGEGKTLTATMPMYLNGLTGPGNFLITANSYLANRDAENLGRVYRFLGLTVMAGSAKAGQDDKDLDKDAIYASDIVYTTNSTLGFDYLIDNLAASQDEQHMRGFKFALIDEIDAVLLDMAQTPLIISGAPRVQSNLFESADQMITLLQKDEDLKLSDDTKKVWFTEQGMAKMTAFFDVGDLLSEANRDLYRHLVMALQAHYLYRRNRDYVIEDGEVALLDVANGRTLDGMRLEAGLHQAIEAKEGVKLTNQTRAMASVTYQNLFRMFPKLAGMTGTALTDADELRETYNVSVIPIPTNKPSIRIDQPDKLFVTNEQKIYASVEAVEAAHKIGRPVLIETGSVSMSNLYSRVLLQRGIVHTLLNARSAPKEAWIVREAGQPGAVTVATSMAGRGTDIALGEGVEAMGGLLVIGTERMTSARIDNQLRGRAGRQGEPGETAFFVSLEDKVVLENAPKRIGRFRQRYEATHEDTAMTEPLTKRRYRRVIQKSQATAEKNERGQRFQTLQFDEVFRLQRDAIYRTRDELMDATDLSSLIESLFERVAAAQAPKAPREHTAALIDFVVNHIDYEYTADALLAQIDRNATKKSVQSLLVTLMQKQLTKQHQQLPDESQFLYFQKLVILKAIDVAWVEQVDNLQQLRNITSNRSKAQRDPVYEYQKEAQRSFDLMKADIADKAVRNLMLSQMVNNIDGTVEVTYP